MPNAINEHYAWLAWSLLPDFNWQRANLLLHFFPDLSTAWEKVCLADWEKLGLGGNLFASLETSRREREWEKVVLKLGKLNLGFISYADADYPSLLREISGPPPVLYFKGGLREEPVSNAAIVGSRKPTSYGLGVTQELAKTLARSGIGIVSGLAYGIDGAAHRATLEAGGKAIAVIGSGLDKESFYPASQFALAEAIAKEGGVVFSEYPPGTPALKHHFPARNRLIAGLAQAVIVVEAREKSGALITALLALEENRELFAVPGRITDVNSVGTNQLIKMGAQPLTSAFDVLDALGVAVPFSPRVQAAADETEESILNVLKEGSLHIDEIAERVPIATAELQSKLTLMELRGLLKSEEKGSYRKI